MENSVTAISPLDDDMRENLAIHVEEIIQEAVQLRNQSAGNGPLIAFKIRRVRGCMSDKHLFYEKMKINGFPKSVVDQYLAIAENWPKLQLIPKEKLPISAAMQYRLTYLTPEQITEAVNVGYITPFMTGKREIAQIKKLCSPKQIAYEEPKQIIITPQQEKKIIEENNLKQEIDPLLRGIDAHVKHILRLYNKAVELELSDADSKKLYESIYSRLVPVAEKANIAKNLSKKKGKK